MAGNGNYQKWDCPAYLLMFKRVDLPQPDGHYGYELSIPNFEVDIVQAQVSYLPSVPKVFLRLLSVSFLKEFTR